MLNRLGQNSPHRSWKGAAAARLPRPPGGSDRERPRRRVFLGGLRAFAGFHC